MMLSLNDLMLIVMAAEGMAILIILLRLSARWGRATGEIEEVVRNVKDMQPTMNRVLQETEARLGQFQQVAQRVDQIASDAQEITGGAKQAAESLFLRFSALMVGAKVGFGAWQRIQRVRNHNHNGKEEHL